MLLILLPSGLRFGLIYILPTYPVRKVYWVKVLLESIVTEGLPTGDEALAFEVNERDKYLPYVLIIVIVI